jgi:hypothetical protein
MKDLTVLFITANEVPSSFAKIQLQHLMTATGDYPLITISRQPMNLGENILDTYPKSYLNIYRQMLVGAKHATTDYVAIAEDDVFYCPEHFNFYRPAPDTFAYNQNRFALFTWGEPIYSMRNRKSNCSLIAPRELMIEALEERFAKYPGDSMPAQYTGELGRKKLEHNLGVTERRSVEVYSGVSIIQFNHQAATEGIQVTRKKRLGQIKAYDIPHWGKASDLVKEYK